MSKDQFYDQLGQALKAQSDRFGASAFDNRRRVIALLADALPEARREIRAVASALDEGAVEALRGVERSLLGMEMDRQADRLEQAVGLRPDLAKQVIRALAFALDLGPAPSVYEIAPEQFAPTQKSPIETGMRAAALPAGASGADVFARFQNMLASGAKTAIFSAQGQTITGLHAAIAAAVIALVVVAAPMFTNQRGQSAQSASLQMAEYAGELIDNGVPAKTTLEPNVGSPTPVSIPGALRVTTVQLYRTLQTDRSILLIDVLADPHTQTIQGAHYLPVAGQAGSFTDAAQGQTAQALQNLTGGDRSRVIVFFCAGAACWESYNAVLRAQAAGFTRVYWYRGGLRSWEEAQLPLQNLPQPGR
jgi:PQQ-dependent catabolism-associated CXXCW motif protein